MEGCLLEADLHLLPDVVDQPTVLPLFGFLDTAPVGAGVLEDVAEAYSARRRVRVLLGLVPAVPQCPGALGTALGGEAEPLNIPLIDVESSRSSSRSHFWRRRCGDVLEHWRRLLRHVSVTKSVRYPSTRFSAKPLTADQAVHAPRREMTSASTSHTSYPLVLRKKPKKTSRVHRGSVLLPSSR